MSYPPPLRSRPNLHLGLTPLTGSPRSPYQSTPPTSASSLSYQSPSTPFGKTAYSPFQSASLKPPTPYNGPGAFSHRGSRKYPHWSYNLTRVKRLLSSKPIWLVLLAAALTVWWFNGGSQELDVVKLGATGLRKDFLNERKMHDFQFYPASNPKIRYVGRWTSTPNRLRKDGAFPGVYFDVTITNTTSLLLALRNAPEPAIDSSAGVSTFKPTALDSSHHRHFHFHTTPNDEKPAPPVSLLARIDDQEYILLPNSSSLVSILSDGLDTKREHHVRVVAPMTDDSGRGVVELDGLWLSKGGTLVKVAGSLLSEDYVDEDLLEAENDQVGAKHQSGLSEIVQDANSKSSRQEAGEDEEELSTMISDRKKILEVVTDSPGSFTGKHRGSRSGGADGLLAGVMGWEYLLGEMFGADHVGIGVDGMCLTQDCISGTGSPAGMGDVFFHSGPYGSSYSEHSWMFSEYIPDVLVFNIGGSDDASFHEYLSDYNKTLWDLSEKFEATYVSLIKAIRGLAYPKHPNIVQSERAGMPGLIPSSSPATIPIFVMRPLRGQLEQACQNAVAKLRADGDKSVFFLDTSGWLDPEIDNNDMADFFLDETVIPPRYRLTEQGNQRVAIFLHLHVCRYLAGAEEKCAFLPHEVYQGKVFNEEEARLDKFIEDEKERKLKKLFWESEEVFVEEVVVG